MKRFIGVLFAIACLAALGVPAEAGHGVGIGVYGHHGASANCGYNHGFYGGGFGYRTSYYGGLPGVYYGNHNRRHHHWHDTSHYDFHPGGFVPHYDHFDYVPPHYDWHEEGHWDHH